MSADGRARVDADTLSGVHASALGAAGGGAWSSSPTPPAGREAARSAALIAVQKQAQAAAAAAAEHAETGSGGSSRTGSVRALPPSATADRSELAALRAVRALLPHGALAPRSAGSGTRPQSQAAIELNQRARQWLLSEGRGASVTALRVQFRIGWKHAQRIHSTVPPPSPEVVRRARLNRKPPPAETSGAASDPAAIRWLLSQEGKNASATAVRNRFRMGWKHAKRLHAQVRAGAASSGSRSSARSATTGGGALGGKSDTGEYYTKVDNETVRSAATKLGVDARALVALNCERYSGLTESARLRTGTHLVTPFLSAPWQRTAAARVERTGLYCTQVDDETVRSIAENLGVDAGALVALNRERYAALTASARLRTGTHLATPLALAKEKSPSPRAREWSSSSSSSTVQRTLEARGGGDARAAVRGAIRASGGDGDGSAASAATAPRRRSSRKPPAAKRYDPSQEAARPQWKQLSPGSAARGSAAQAARPAAASAAAAVRTAAPRAAEPDSAAALASDRLAREKERAASGCAAAVPVAAAARVGRRRRRVAPQKRYDPSVEASRPQWKKRPETDEERAARLREEIAEQRRRLEVATARKQKREETKRKRELESDAGRGASSSGGAAAAKRKKLARKKAAAPVEAAPRDAVAAAPRSRRFFAAPTAAAASAGKASRSAASRGRGLSSSAARVAAAALPPAQRGTLRRVRLAQKRFDPSVEAARPQWGGASSAAATVAPSDAALYHRSVYVHGELVTSAVFNAPRRNFRIDWRL
jgi:hypothetical protein